MKYINEYNSNNSYEKNLLYQGDNKIKIYIASLIKDLEIKYHKDYPHSTFFVHKDTKEVWMENYKKTGYFFVSYLNILDKIITKFPHLTHGSKHKDLIKYTVEIAFQIRIERYISTPHPKRRKLWEKISKDFKRLTV